MRLCFSLPIFGLALGLTAAVTAAPAERVVTLAEGTAFTFVEIPAGKFSMGSPEAEVGRGRDEGPVHEVTISRPFWRSKACGWC